MLMEGWVPVFQHNPPCRAPGRPAKRGRRLSGLAVLLPNAARAEHQMPAPRLLGWAHMSLCASSNYLHVVRLVPCPSCGAVPLDVWWSQGRFGLDIRANFFTEGVVRY